MDTPIEQKSSWMPALITIVVVVVGLGLYFAPQIMNSLSLPEQVLEEEVKREIDKNKTVTVKREEEELLDEYGYCYIGTDRDVRSCSNIKPGDKCMSGEIFPRRDICVNPRLRL
jgi:hypothetical protein